MKDPRSVLLVDDDMAFRGVLGGELRRLGYAVEAVSSGEEAVRKAAELEPDVVLLDLRLPGMTGLNALKAIRDAGSTSEVIMLTGHGSIDTAIESIKVGAFDYVLKPCPLDEIRVRIERALERRALSERARLLERGLTPPDLSDSFLGESPEFRRLLKLIERVGTADSTVLITGETGTGKERAAKLIHARSPRRLRPFVIVDCTVLEETLLQSELFGHERGAFTGAERTKPGLFEVANGGTLFLDEIGELSPATQTKLLRVLDNASFRHVGGTAEIHVDVRVLAATNRDLAAMVRQGLFREDLFYRLSTILIELPPLRERGADIELLARHFVATFNRRFQCLKQISDDALDMLRRHNWPGNVRELLHAIEASMIVSEGCDILPQHLPPALRKAPAAGRSQNSEAGGLPTLEELELAHIRLALDKSGGHRGNAAKLLGISERNLYRKIRDYGLPL